MMLTEPSASTNPEPITFEHQLDFRHAPTHAHRWRQQGMRVTCVGCGIDHGFFVPPNKKLIGNKNGEPVFETLP